jgi:hypothetical protein
MISVNSGERIFGAAKPGVLVFAWGTGVRPLESAAAVPVVMREAAKKVFTKAHL